MVYGSLSIVKQVYEAIASSYAYLRRRLWAPVSVVVKGKGLYLDGGCGPGHYAVMLAEKHGVEIVCLDLAYGMVKIACSRAKRKDVDGLVHCVEGDLVKLPFRNKAFKGLYYVASIHHVMGWRFRLKCIVEAVRVAKKGARILVTVWALVQLRFATYPIKWIVYALMRLAREFGDNLVPWRHKGRILWRYYHLYTLGELKRMFRVVKDVECVYGSISVKSKVFPENHYALCVVDS